MRPDMHATASTEDLVEELELRFPEQVKLMENRHPEAWEAAQEGGLDELRESEPELVDELDEDLRELISVT